VAPLEQIEKAESELYLVAAEGGVEGKAKSFAEATKDALRTAEKALNSGGHLSGITTGLEGLNSKIGGLHPSDLIIVAGRPGMGKSSLATNIAFAAAQRFLRDTEDGIDPAQSGGAPVALFSLEMSADQLATRILAEQSGISSESLRMGKISQQEFRQLARAAGELESLPLYIDDTPGLTIAALRARARRLKRQKKIGMVIVDYLQLLQGTGKGGNNENRVQEISEISRGLKTLAKELDLPVIGLSQLSRAVEQREDKRPQLSDLRESGSIEQDADIVLFIYRDDYYLKGAEVEMPTPEEASTNLDKVAKYNDWKAKFEQVAGKAELLVAKQRHGSTGIVRVRFDGRTTKFSDSVDEGYLPESRG
jgi:replicative DNA helicase